MFLSAYTKYPLIFLTSFSRLLPNNKKRKKEKKKDDVLENIYGKMTHFPKYVNVKTKKE